MMDDLDIVHRGAQKNVGVSASLCLELYYDRFKSPALIYETLTDE